MKPLFIFILILLFLNLIVIFSFKARLFDQKGMNLSLAIGFFLFFVLQTIAPLFSFSGLSIHLAHPPMALIRASFLALGVLTCLVAFTLAFDVLSLAVRLAFPACDTPRFRALGAAFVLLCTAGSVGAGLVNAGKTRVEKVDLFLPRLPSAFEGFKIVQLSDLHIGAFLGHRFVQDVTQKVQAAQPDLVVFTGDLADGLPRDKAEDLAPLKTLAPPFGKLAITGNHEYYWGAQGWIAVLEQNGFHTLMNDHVLVTKDEAQLLIAGIPDSTATSLPATPPPSLRDSLIGAPEGIVKILLAHKPKEAPAAREAGFDAQLSGHTHGGQYFPFTFLIRFVDPTFKGLYDLGAFRLYVNRGTGFWGPPLRTGGPGEITLITLHREQS